MANIGAVKEYQQIALNGSLGDIVRKVTRAASGTTKV